jgi:signal peptidase (SPase) II
MNAFATLDLDAYWRRVALMTTAMLLAFGIDFAAKTVAVALDPQTLLFNISSNALLGVHASLVLVVAGSLAACVLPTRVVAIGAGVALGGALGNVASRELWAEQGGSPDFIPFADGSTGNVADIFIFTGGIAMLLGAFLWFGFTALESRRTRA